MTIGVALDEPVVRRLVDAATREARRVGHGWCGAEHAWAALATSTELAATLQTVGLTVEVARAALRESAAFAEPTSSGAAQGVVALTPRLDRALERCRLHAALRGEPLGPRHLALALYDEIDSLSVRADYARHGVRLDELGLALRAD